MSSIMNHNHHHSSRDLGKVHEDFDMHNYRPITYPHIITIEHESYIKKVTMVASVALAMIAIFATTPLSYVCLYGISLVYIFNLESNKQSIIRKCIKQNISYNNEYRDEFKTRTAKASRQLKELSDNSEHLKKDAENNLKNSQEFQQRLLQQEINTSNDLISTRIKIENIKNTKALSILKQQNAHLNVLAIQQRIDNLKYSNKEQLEKLHELENSLNVIKVTQTNLERLLELIQRNHNLRKVYDRLVAAYINVITNSKGFQGPQQYAYDFRQLKNLSTKGSLKALIELLRKIERAVYTNAITIKKETELPAFKLKALVNDPNFSLNKNLEEFLTLLVETSDSDSSTVSDILSRVSEGFKKLELEIMKDITFVVQRFYLNIPSFHTTNVAAFYEQIEAVAKKNQSELDESSLALWVLEEEFRTENLENILKDFDYYTSNISLANQLFSDNVQILLSDFFQRLSDLSPQRLQEASQYLNQALVDYSIAESPLVMELLSKIEDNLNTADKKDYQSNSEDDYAYA